MINLCFIAGYVQGDGKYREQIMEYFKSGLDLPKPKPVNENISVEESYQVLGAWFGKYRSSLGY